MVSQGQANLSHVGRHGQDNNHDSRSNNIIISPFLCLHLFSILPSFDLFHFSCLVVAFSSKIATQARAVATGMSQHSQASSSSKATQSRSNININNDKTSPSQVQQQSEQPSDRPTKRSQPSKRPERRRSKSSSPEKLKVLTRQPSLRLPPYNVDATKWEVDSIGIPPDSTRGTGDEFEGQNLEITRRLDAFQGAGRLRASSFNYARPRPDSYLARCDPPPSLESPYTHLKRPLQRYASPSPETSPTNATLDLDLSPTMTSSDSDGQTSCIPAVPHYVKLFRPRYPPEDPAEPFISPIPNFQSLEHAMAIKEGLTKFHVGVILVDEDAGMDREKRTVGLERVIEENMPTLKALDVVSALFLSLLTCNRRID